MIDPWSESRLAQVLASVGEHLDTDPAATIGREREPAWSPRRWLTAAAAAVAVLVGLALAIAPVREAVADFLGIGSTEVEIVPEPDADPAGLPTIDEGLTVITPSAAASRLGHALPDVAATRLGEPDQISVMPEGGVLLVWSDGATTLWIHGGSIPGDILLSKLIGDGQDAQKIDGLGDAALMVRGEHVLETPHRRVRAGTVVLWTIAGAEYRLESDLDAATMLEIADDLD
jgi:hypothetical protein